MKFWELGHGAMGVVYRARDPIINRLVALKTITTGLADDPNLLQRFYREAQSAGGLQHPNIVTIYDMGKNGKSSLHRDGTDRRRKPRAERFPAARLSLSS